MYPWAVATEAGGAHIAHMLKADLRSIWNKTVKWYARPRYLIRILTLGWYQSPYKVLIQHTYHTYYAYPIKKAYEQI